VLPGRIKGRRRSKEQEDAGNDKTYSLPGRSSRHFRTIKRGAQKARGSIKANKDAAGKWQVVLEDEGQDVEGRGRQAIKDAYIQDLRERIEELKKDKEHLRQLLSHRDEEIAWSNMQRSQLEKRVQVLLEAPKPGRRWWPFSRKE